MKTEREAKAIQKFCDALSAALTESGNPTELRYENKGEHVTGDVIGYAIEISVKLDNVAASARDIMRGVTTCYEREKHDRY